MSKFKTREYISEFKGMKDVVKTTIDGKFVVYHTKEVSFVDYVKRFGSVKIYIDDIFHRYFYLLNSKNETVDYIKLSPKLRGFTIQQMKIQYKRLFIVKRYSQCKGSWDNYLEGNLSDDE